MKPTILAAAAMAAFGLAAHAQQANPDDHSAHHPPQAAVVADPAAAVPESEGEVRRIDLTQGKVTLRHGPLANLDMPAMTMVFTATDKQLLQGLKEGDKVRFTAARENGSYLVRAIRRAN